MAWRCWRAAWGRPRAGWAWLAGTVVFSGSLYLLALSGLRWLGAITPLGGIALLLGWGFAFLSAREGTPAPDTSRGP